MKEQVLPVHVEPRWPVALAVFASLSVIMLLPDRIHLFPPWFRYLIGAALILPMAGVALSRGNPRWLRIERITTLIFSAVTEAVAITLLSFLVLDLVSQRVQLSGQQLLTSSIGGWIVNVLVFSMMYWMLDRGGPEARANDEGPRPDWLFPQTSVPDEAPPDWRPVYLDYLFLSFTAATAFSPTDTMPLTARAKILMMFESGVSLVTVVLVASRAINILA